MTPDSGMSFEMEKYMKKANPEFAFPVGRILELNPDHEAVKALQTEEEKKELENKAEELKGFLTFVKESLGDQVKEVKISANLGSHPVCMTPEAGMSFEMEKYMKKANPDYAFPVGRILELNMEHDAVKALQSAMTEDPVKAKDYAQLLCYQAQLMADLPIDDPVAYTDLVCKLMK